MSQLYIGVLQKTLRVYRVFSVPYFPVFGLDWFLYDNSLTSVFSPNAGKYGPEKTLYLDTFHAVRTALKHFENFQKQPWQNPLLGKSLTSNLEFYLKTPLTLMKQDSVPGVFETN